jgi:hypothetical protein
MSLASPPQTAAQLALSRKLGAEIAKDLVVDLRTMGLPAVRRVRGVLAAAVLAGSAGCARAQDDGSGPPGVLAPKPPASVREEPVEPPLLDLNLTGRTGDVFPRIDGTISIELQNDYTAHSNDTDHETNDLTTSDDVSLAVRLTPELSLRTDTFQVSAGYEFDSDISVNVGYGYNEENGIADNLIGVLLLYEFDVRVR